MAKKKRKTGKTKKKSSGRAARWRKCPKCRAFYRENGAHACLEPSEERLLEELSEELLEAWEELRGFAENLGPQRIYPSLKAVMFARKHCYLFVRPKKSYLETCFFLEKAVSHPLIHKVDERSSKRVCHTVRLVHREQVEPPLTDWIGEAFAWAPDTQSGK